MTRISKQKFIFKSFRKCLGTEMRKLAVKPLPTHPIYCNAHLSNATQWVHNRLKQDFRA